MSHSRKKNMAGGNLPVASEKEDKRLWHRAFRRENKALAKIQVWQKDEVIFPVVKEKSNPWTMAKDGKYFYGTTEIRKQIDSAIKEAQEIGFSYRYRSNVWILKKMCEFLGVPQTSKAISRIKQKDIDRFLKVYINSETSK